MAHVVRGFQIRSGLDQHARHVRVRIERCVVQRSVALCSASAVSRAGRGRTSVGRGRPTDLCLMLTSAPRLSSSRAIFALALSADQWSAA